MGLDLFAFAMARIVDDADRSAVRNIVVNLQCWQEAVFGRDRVQGYRRVCDLFAA